MRIIGYELQVKMLRICFILKCFYAYFVSFETKNAHCVIYVLREILADSCIGIISFSEREI